MIAFFANIFGYVLNFIYEIVKNYGLAIIKSFNDTFINKTAENNEEIY